MSTPRTRRFRAPAALLAAALAAASAWVGPADADGPFRGWDEGFAEAARTGRPVVVDVYTTWCGWCRRMERDVYGRADVREYLASRFVAIKLDAESARPASLGGRRQTERGIAAHFRVTGYPTTMFMRANGEHLANVPGYVPADRFLLLLRFVGEGHADRGERFQDFVRREGGR